MIDEDDEFESPILGCSKVHELLEAAKILEELRQVEGNAITLFCDNPDFNGQPNAAVEMYLGSGRFPVRFTGDNLLEALRKSLAANRALPQ